MADLYNEKVMDHFMKPRNVGIMKDADGIGEVGNPTCGDIMKIYIKVSKKSDKEIIDDIKFQTLGCGAAIATSSMVTEMVKGKTLEEAERVTNTMLAEQLAG
jgi:nitrogen fixation NifU-like protein